MNWVFLPEAYEDLEDLVAYFDNESEAAAEEFRASVREALDRIVKSPRSWPRFSRGVRLVQLRKFRKIGIFYRIANKKVYVQGVIHLQRGPKYIRRRLR